MNQVISNQGRTPNGVTSASITTAEFTSIKEFAIQEINLHRHGLWMSVANTGGSVLVFHLKMGEAATTPKVTNSHSISTGWLTCKHCEYYPPFVCCKHAMRMCI